MKGKVKQIVKQFAKQNIENTQKSDKDRRISFVNGVPGRIRTCDPLLRRQPLYSAELQGLATKW